MSKSSKISPCGGKNESQSLLGALPCLQVYTSIQAHNAGKGVKRLLEFYLLLSSSLSKIPGIPGYQGVICSHASLCASLSWGATMENGSVHYKTYQTLSYFQFPEITDPYFPAYIS